jgi:hypothetical protein
MQTILLLTISNIFMTIAWWASQVQRLATVDRDSGELGDCLRRVLLPGACESDRALPVQRCAIENHPGSDYPGRVLRLFGGLSEGRVEMELSGWFCHDGRGGLRNLQRMVK